MNTKTIGVIVGAVLIAGAAFAGGFAVSQSRASDTAAGIGQGGPGGGFAQLTDSERQQLQTMTEEERQQFFEEKGFAMPARGQDASGTPGGFPGGGRGPGGGILEGTIVSMDAEKITVQLASGGSATAYVDTDTVIAAPEGGTPKLAEGATVLVFSQPEADGVNAATAIIVK